MRSFLEPAFIRDLPSYETFKDLVLHRDKFMLLIIPKRIFCLIFKIAKFPALNHSNVFPNSNCYKINLIK